MNGHPQTKPPNIAKLAESGVCFERAYSNNPVFVRIRRWRYVLYNNGSEGLYDHDVDPYEWTNLSSDSRCAQVKADLKAKLLQMPQK